MLQELLKCLLVVLTEAPDMSTDLSIGGLMAPDLSTGGSKGP